MPVVSDDDHAVPDADTVGSTSVQPVRMPFKTTPSNAGQNPALAAARVDESLIDRLMAGQGDSAEAMWVL